jgi:caffeoyl-CoA O-methyltransferase
MDNEYLENLVFLNTDERLISLREKSKQRDIPIIRDKSFNLLLTVVSMLNPKSILEIGTANGCSGIGMLLEAPSARLTGIEINEDIVLEAKQNLKDFGLSERARFFVGDANEIIPQLTGKYDFIFLDGPKGHYKQYLPWLLPLLNAGGVLFADNVLFRGLVDGSQKGSKRNNTIIYSMRAFLEEVSKDKNLKTTVLDIEDGVSISLKIKD